MKTRIITHLYIIIFTFTFSLFTFSNEVKKIKNDRAMIQFSMDLRKGDAVEITDDNGDIVAKGTVTAIRKNQAIVRLSSGVEEIKPGQKVRLPPAPFETESGSDEEIAETENESEETEEKETATYRKSTKTYSDRGFHLGFHGGYTLPQITGAEGALSYGLLLGYRLSDKMDISLNTTSFAYSGVRFILPFLRGAYAPLDGLPLFLGIGAGASYITFAGDSILDFGAKIFGNYEYSFTPEFSISPEVSWIYIFPVSSRTVYSYTLFETALRFRYYF